MIKRKEEYDGDGDIKNDFSWDIEDRQKDTMTRYCIFKTLYILYVRTRNDGCDAKKVREEIN